MLTPDSEVISRLGSGVPPENAAGLPREFLGTELGHLLQAYRPYLLGVAWQMLPKGLLGKVAPSDVVQETLLRGYREFPEFSGNDLPELVAWLRQILVNQVADHVRRFDAGKRSVSREVRLDDDLVDTQALSPSQPLLSAEEWQRLEFGLNRLSTLHREVILLRHREGYTFNQIGDLLGKSPDAVRKLWERALLNLQQLLGTGR
jgi:RNA polymerase sigma-70 factor (ECF subfamily)